MVVYLSKQKKRWKAENTADECESTFSEKSWNFYRAIIGKTDCIHDNITQKTEWWTWAIRLLTSVHPSILCTCWIPSEVTGLLEPSGVTSWTGHLFAVGAHKHIQTYGQLETSVILQSMFLDYGRKLQWENSHVHEENMLTPHMKYPVRLKKNRLFSMWGEGANHHATVQLIGVCHSS